MRHDASGRPIYVYDPRSFSDSPAAQVLPPPAPPLPPAYAQPAYPPPDPYAPPPAYPPAPPARGQAALVWAPLGGTSFSDWFSDQTWHSNQKYAGLAALEFRGAYGGGRLRLSGEYGPVARVGELSLKYDFNDEGMFRPFLSVGVGAARLEPDLGFDRKLRGELSGSFGLDLYLTRNLFLTGELKGRVFAKQDADLQSLGNIGQTAAFFGGGLYF